MNDRSDVLPKLHHSHSETAVMNVNGFQDDVENNTIITYR